MKFELHNDEARERTASNSPHRRSGPGNRDAFTLIEIMMTSGLLLVLVTSSLSALLFLNRSSARMADYTAAMASVHGRMEAVRAATYTPPTSPFLSTTYYQTNFSTIALSRSGSNYMITGTVVTAVSPVAAGHLVQVTGVFAARGSTKPMTNKLETIVNRFSGGQH